MQLKKKIIAVFKANDTPQRIALGLGLGVFLGILPGTGPIAALFLAFILPINRLAILLGSLLTNTWLSIVTFFLSIKLGSAIMKVNWQDVQINWSLFLHNFSWCGLFKFSALKLILPVMVGYFVVAFGLGLVAYGTSLIILIQIKHANKKIASR